MGMKAPLALRLGGTTLALRLEGTAAALEKGGGLKVLPRLLEGSDIILPFLEPGTNEGEKENAMLEFALNCSLKPSSSISAASSAAFNAALYSL